MVQSDSVLVCYHLQYPVKEALGSTHFACFWGYVKTPKIYIYVFLEEFYILVLTFKPFVYLYMVYSFLWDISL
jgi:hypothetical protein